MAKNALFLGIAALVVIGCAPSDDKAEAKAPGVQVAKAAAAEAPQAGAAAATTAPAPVEPTCAGAQGGETSCGEAKAEGEPTCAGAAAGAACGEAKAAGALEVETGCGQHGAGSALTNTAERPVTKADGAAGTHIGGDFAQSEAVKVSELIANPDAYKGKTVLIEGDISAMCHHKRGWFSVVAEDKSGTYVRVSTAPTFLVPRGSIGKFGRAEGTVEVIEVAAKHAKHLAKEHKLGDPAEIKANVKRVVIRATGAEFF